MSLRAQPVLLVGGGLIAGLLAGWAVAAAYYSRGPAFLLIQDVPLRSGYGVTATGQQVLHAGQQFDVYMRKGDVNYLRVYVITYDRDLVGRTRNAGKSSRSVTAPWDQPPVTHGPASEQQPAPTPTPGA